MQIEFLVIIGFVGYSFKIALGDKFLKFEFEMEELSMVKEFLSQSEKVVYGSLEVGAKP